MPRQFPMTPREWQDMAAFAVLMLLAAVGAIFIRWMGGRGRDG